MVRSRIAPTPSGYLHFGNAAGFVLTWLWVRRQKGSLRLRIDDQDTTRSRPEYIQDIFKTLDWLGLTWDEGPQTPDAYTQQFAQLHHAHRYNILLNQLIATGKVFACACPRSEIAGQYSGACSALHLPLNTPQTALRINTPPGCVVTVHDVQQGNVPVNMYDEMRHFTIRRRDGIAAYQLSSLADDLAYQINLIVRGADLLHSTAAQLYLAQLTGHGAFAQCRFYHHPLIFDAQGHKLSKSAGSASLKAWREGGNKPADFYLKLSKLWGWKENVTSAAEMLEVAAGELHLPDGAILLQ